MISQTTEKSVNVVSNLRKSPDSTTKIQRFKALWNDRETSCTFSRTLCGFSWNFVCLFFTKFRLVVLIKFVLIKGVCYFWPFTNYSIALSPPSSFRNISSCLSLPPVPLICLIHQCASKNLLFLDFIFLTLHNPTRLQSLLKRRSDDYLFASKFSLKTRFLFSAHKNLYSRTS